MAAGLGLLRLRPADFWSMTPKELDAALRGLLGPAHDREPLSRAALAELMSRHPDRPSPHASRASHTVAAMIRPTSASTALCASAEPGASA
jgi:uncharacterized phage protein (TIGR02216 family)